MKCPGEQLRSNSAGQGAQLKIRQRIDEESKIPRQNLLLRKLLFGIDYRVFCFIF